MECSHQVLCDLFAHLQRQTNKLRQRCFSNVLSQIIAISKVIYQSQYQRYLSLIAIYFWLPPHHETFSEKKCNIFLNVICQCELRFVLGPLNSLVARSRILIFYVSYVGWIFLGAHDE